MNKSIRETVLITVIFVISAFASAAKAAHAAAHLDPLHLAVSNRIADTNVALSRAQQQALRNADRTLSRNSKTLAADVNLLGAAARALNRPFTNEFVALEDEALDIYAGEGQAQLDLAELRVGTNVLTKGASNKLARAQAALNRAIADTNGPVRQAQLLAVALTQIRTATAPIFRKYTNDVPTGPTAPLTLAGKDLDLFQSTNVNNQVQYFLDPYVEGGTGNYDGHNPNGSEDVGQWSYTRINDTQGEILLNPDFPPGAANHVFTLTFLTPTSGTFTGQTLEGQNISGTFTVFTIVR